MNQPNSSAYFEGECSDIKDGRVYPVALYDPSLLAMVLEKRYPDRARRFAVNLGASDGKSCNDPTYPLFALGYNGLAVEGGPSPDLFTNLPSPGIRKLDNTWITPGNVASLLSDGQCPVDCDFLKLDIDGYDGPVLQSILEAGYRPKVLQLEVNPEFPPPVEFAVLYDPDYRYQDKDKKVGGFYSASMSYFIKLTAPFGYTLCYLDFITDFTHDVTLVREEYAPVAASVFGRRFQTGSPREVFLSHPSGFSHFAEYGIDSFTWRYRTDFEPLLEDIRKACTDAAMRKHDGRSVPFHLALG